MKRASFGWQCFLFAALVCGWVISAHSQAKKLWQVYAEAGETAFQDTSRQATAEVMLLSAIKEAKSEGVQDPWLGKINYELGRLYSGQGHYDYDKAERYFMAALRVWEQCHEPETQIIANCLNDLSWSLVSQGRRKEAEVPYTRAIGIFEKLNESSNVAIVVNNLASNYTAQDKYPEAEKCVKEGLEFVEQSKKANDETVASLVEALATIYLAQNRIDEAEAAYRRELAVLTKQSASPSLATANAFNGLADVHYRMRRFQEAETEKTQAIETREKAVGANVILDWARADLALIQYAQSHGARAESLFQESLDSMKKRRAEMKSPEDQKNLSKQIADRLERLAELYGGEGKNEQSASLYKEALEIREKDIGRNDRRTIATTKTYVGVLRKLKRDAEADELDARLKGVPK